MATLTPMETYIMDLKGTEPPYSGKYVNFDRVGTYACRRCEAPIFHSNAKFDGKCGWACFDDELYGNIRRDMQYDGQIDVSCRICGGHFGQLYIGEGQTVANVRFTVNSTSLIFEPKFGKNLDNKEIKIALFAGGHFHGMQYFLERAKGVINTFAGYVGGERINPTYEQVEKNLYNHMHGVKVEYDINETTYEELAKVFFESHDLSDYGVQGDQSGGQYLSVVYTFDDKEDEIIKNLINELNDNGYRVCTVLLPIEHNRFYLAEEEHQHYCDKMGIKPPNHFYEKKF